MAEKSFGVKELHVTGTGTPTVQTTGNLNLTASGTVAVSNNLTIGGQVTSNAYVTGRIGLGKDPSSTTYPLEVSSATGNGIIVWNDASTYQTAIASGVIDLTRDTPLIDFKNSTSEDYDGRIQLEGGSSLEFYSGGQGNTARALRCDSSKNVYVDNKLYVNDVEVTGGSGGATALSALTDTTITSPAKNETLIYNATESKWRNIPQSVANVKDYGAKGDNSTDDRQAIQDAIDSLAAGGADITDGGIVYLPSGVYKISSPLSFNSTHQNIALVGSSKHYPLSPQDTNYRGGTVIRATNASMNGINITDAQNISVSNIAIDALGVTKTSGSAIRALSATDNAGVTVESVMIRDFNCGIDIDGYSQSVVENIQIRSFPNTEGSHFGVRCACTGDTRTDQVRFKNIIVDAIVGSSTRHTYVTGFLFRDYVNTTWLEDCAFLRCNIGIRFDSNMGSGGNGSTGAFHRILNCDIDHARTNAIEVNGGTTIWLDNCYISSNDQNGIVVNQTFGGVLWVLNCDIRVNGMHGMFVYEGARKIHITNCHIGNNSQAVNYATGLYLDNNVDDVIVRGGQYGGDTFGATTGAVTASVSQKWGIYVAGTDHKRITISDVDCTNNQDGSIAWTASGTNVLASSYNFITNAAGYSTGQTSFP